MSITLSALQQQRRDTAANWTSANPTLLGGEWGYETDTGKWKVGDGSTAWTSLAYVAIPDNNGLIPIDQLLLPLGTAAAPSLAFTGDVNTGLYSPGADQLAISTNGTGRLFVDADGNVGIGAAPTSGRSLHVQGAGFQEVLVEKTDASTSAILLAADSGLAGIYTRTTATDSTAIPLGFFTGNTERLRITSDGKLGLGTSSPDGPLHVSSTASNFHCQLHNPSATTGAQARLYLGASTLFPRQRGTALVAEYNADASHNMQFWVSASGGAGPTEMMRLTNTGRLGVGTTSPERALHVQDDGQIILAKSLTGDAIIRVDAQSTAGADAYFWVRSSTTGTGGLRFGTNLDADVGWINYDHSDNSMAFRVNGAERARIDSSGRLGVGTTGPSTVLHCSATDAVLTLQGTRGTGASATIGTGGANSQNLLITAGTDLYYRGAIQLFQNVAGTTEYGRWDSSGRLLVGTSSAPSDVTNGAHYAKLVSVGNTDSATGDGRLALCRGNTAANLSSGNNIGELHFADSAGGGFASISAFADAAPGTSDYPGRLVFSTTADGASSPTERMRISSDGTLTAGNANATNGQTIIDGWYTDADRLNVFGSQYSSGGTVLSYACKPKSGAAGYVSSAGNGNFRRVAIELGESSRGVTFKHAAAATVAVGTDVTLSRIAAFTPHGLSFGDDIGQANALDDYEEGTWTPTVGGTATYTNQQGSYIKIGKFVHVTFYVTISNIGTGSTSTISGLPFSGDANTGGGPIAYWANAASNYVYLSAYNYNNSDLVFYGATTGSSNLTATNALQTNTVVQGSLVYRTT